MTSVNTGFAESLIEQNRIQSEGASRRAARLKDTLQNLGIFVPFIVILVTSAIFVPNFLSQANVTNMLIDSAILGIIGLGQTLVIAVRGLDLSVGSLQALIACSAAIAAANWGTVSAVAVGVGVGAIAGFGNSLLVTQFRVPDFIATLSTMTIFRGLVLLITGGAPIVIASTAFKSASTTAIVGVPVPFVVLILVGVCSWLILNRTAFGRHVIAVGSAPAAAADSGVSVARVVTIAYIVCGILTGIAGLLLASQLGIVNGTISTGLELKAIAIVVLGGTSMMGGRPRFVGTILGSLVLSMIYSSLNLLNVSSFYQYVALGALLVFALALDSTQRALVKRAQLMERNRDARH
ncbi:ABC transporter permease [Schaalia sp. ZJ405]|uniref:ABC transporter permease n=1 Tax=Schaalia sp. ZJ405 TaxID=2709403 RepID=UPI0013EA616B|nr:ABC transporter permease [Schaalia sp. ZJ405]QPK80939.1 ABC transporter permease [Schaalia sp. ZJ405]